MNQGSVSASSSAECQHTRRLWRSESLRDRGRETAGNTNSSPTRGASNCAVGCQMVPRWRPKRTPACHYCGFCAIRAEHAARFCRRGDRVIGRFFAAPQLRSAPGPDLTDRDGQSRSALPDYFRRQLVPLLPRHHLLRFRDISPCFRSWCGQAEAGQP